MADLIKMEMYRMRKNKAFLVLLVISFLISFAQIPVAKLIMFLASVFDTTGSLFPKTRDLSEIISDPFPIFNAMFAMLSVCAFFYADLDKGYIKNIAGQVPRRGHTMISRFIAAIPHHLLFMLAGVVGNLIGTAIFVRVVPDAGTAASVGTFFIKFLLMMAVTAVLLFVTAACGVKSLGTVLAVFFGMGLMSLIYMGISAALTSVFKLRSFQLGDYMPDQLLGMASPAVFRSVCSAAVTIAVFLPLSIYIFNRRDVK